MHQARLLLRNWSCPLPLFFFPAVPRDGPLFVKRRVIPESRGQNRICPRRSHEASSSRLLNYFPSGENYSWATSILAEILGSPVSLLHSPYLFVFILSASLFISLIEVVSHVIFSYRSYERTDRFASRSRSLNSPCARNETLHSRPRTFESATILSILMCRTYTIFPHRLACAHGVFYFQRRRRRRRRRAGPGRP